MTKEASRFWSGRGIVELIYLALRYYTAYMILTYGFAKVMGAQFTILDSQLARPMGQVSGFWLTWYYFGYSPVYSNIIAGTQIVGAILLCFRRSTLAGALLLLPVMVNIVCVDWWVIHFPPSSGALRNAIFALLSLVVILAYHAKQVWSFLTKERDSVFFRRRPLATYLTQVVLVAGMLFYTAHQAYWLANTNNRSPTPIDGAWQVVHTQPNQAALPDWIFFEYNRAYMVVFGYADDVLVTHDFRIDPAAKTLSISTEWLNPGNNVFEGHWQRDGDNLRLEGHWGDGSSKVIILRRKDMPVKDHE